jgi:probable F420-dependent oxidoreductase
VTTIDQQRAEVRRALGRVGAWSFALDELSAGAERQTVAEIEEMGYPALWVPEGLASKEIVAHASLLLAASERLTVAAGIANMWARDAVSLANASRLLSDDHPGRFVLGIGVGHGYSTTARGSAYRRPLSMMREYLDRMDDAPTSAPEPARPAPRLLAALGPRMLELAAERTAGAHTYFVPVEHTLVARRTLGPRPVLAVEQTVVLTDDTAVGRRLAREFSSSYLELPNYANNLVRLGFAEPDVTGAGSDRLVEATIAIGGVDTVAERVRAHLEAGADHVAIQVLSEGAGATAVRELRELAPALLDG